MALADADVALTEEVFVKCLLKECSKERLEYKINALEATSKILRALDLDYFQQLYDMLHVFIERKEAEGVDPDEQQETISLDLQLAVVQCLGQAWPETPETQNASVIKLLNTLDTMMQNTTRKLHLAIIITIGQIISSYNLTKALDATVFDKIGSTLAFALSIPKNSQLRTEALKVIDQALDILDKADHDIIESFQQLMGKSLEDVIKDLATDAALKDKARTVRQRLTQLGKMECD